MIFGPRCLRIQVVYQNPENSSGSQLLGTASMAQLQCPRPWLDDNAAAHMPQPTAGNLSRLSPLALAGLPVAEIRKSHAKALRRKGGKLRRALCALAPLRETQFPAVLLTNAIFLLSGDQLETLIVPCRPPLFSGQASAVRLRCRHGQ